MIQYVPSLDRIRRILYQLPIMRTKRGRRLSLLTAGLGAGVILLHAGSGLADSVLPVPDRKPPVLVETVASVPVPPLKPVMTVMVRTLEHTLTEVSVSDTNRSGSVPLPPSKPQNIKGHEHEHENETGEAHRIAQTDVMPLPARKPALAKRSLPNGPLSDRDAEHYRTIFALQARGQMEKASAEISRLDNGILMGHVLAQRYLHPTAYQSRFGELQEWLETYNDHPQAAQIYKLAMQRKPQGFSGTLKKPQTGKTLSGMLGSVSAFGRPYKSAQDRSATESREVQELLRAVERFTEKGEPAQGWNRLNEDPAAKHMDAVEYDRLRAIIAAGYLYAGKADDAKGHALAALKRSGRSVPQAGWISGLTYWQDGDYKRAASAFENAASSPYASGWMISAASYWAARAHGRAGNRGKMKDFLKLSAAYPRTFYGLIATRALGRDPAFDWTMPALKDSHIKTVESLKAGKRARALIAAGQEHLAEAELQQVNPGKDPRKREALLAYTYHFKLPSMSMRLGGAISGPKGTVYNAALYPMVPWEPEDGYRIDRALIHAIIRQESRFNAAAESHSGAAGLMQLMPATASYVAGKKLQPYHLKEPHLNLGIGQRYIESLLSHEYVGQDLLSLAIAYNAGPGNLSRWKDRQERIEDPLLFIETIPFSETRAFVERVLANFWMYRLRLDQPTPSLDAVAQGKWARYAAMDDGTVRFAKR